MPGKTLILSVSAGVGHLRAAEALEKEFRRLNSGMEIRNLDVLKHTNRFFDRLYGGGYLALVQKAPAIYRWMFDHFNRPWQPGRLVPWIDRVNAGPLIKLLLEWRPDMIASTHFLAAELVSALKEKGRLAARHGVVVTDYDAHALWLCRGYEQYFVGMEETKVQLEAAGISGDKVTVSGVPIDPVFAEIKDPCRLRVRLGLEPNTRTILVSTGGFGVGPIEGVMKAIVKVRHPVQVVFNCGRNEALRRRLTSLAAELPKERAASITVIGFTYDMDEYLAASDILVGKPGGLTVSESLAKGTVMVLINPIPGQEERNADLLLEKGVALRCNDLGVLAYKIERLLMEPERLAEMRRRALSLARPRAARDIAEWFLRAPRDHG
jgi:processive 1,2-diacylglycerol beta-glucosyltransferase